MSLSFFPTRCFSWFNCLSRSAIFCLTSAQQSSLIGDGNAVCSGTAERVWGCDAISCAARDADPANMAAVTNDANTPFMILFLWLIVTWYSILSHVDLPVDQ